MLITAAVWAALVPAAVAALLLHAAWRPGTRPDAGRQATGPALAFGLAYAAASLGTSGGLPGASSPEGRLLIVAVLAAAIAIAEARFAAVPGARLALQLLGSAAAALLVVQPLITPQRWGVGETALRLVAVTGANVLAWTAIRALAHKERGASLAAGLSLLAASAAAVITLAGLASAGQLAGAMAAALGAAVILLCLRPGAARLQGAAPVLALLIVGHLSVGMLYGEMPAESYLLLAVAPLALFAVNLPALRRRAAPAALVGVRLLAVAALASAAVAISAQSYFGGPAATKGDHAPAGERATAFDQDYGY